MSNERGASEESVCASAAQVVLSPYSDEKDTLLHGAILTVSLRCPLIEDEEGADLKQKRARKAPLG
jgi:hypothetical protein